MRNDVSGMPLFVHRRMHQSGGSFFWYHLLFPELLLQFRLPNPISLGLSQAPLPEAQPTISAPTISIENQTEGNIQRKIVTPHFSGFPGADELNAKIVAEQQDAMADLEETAAGNGGAGQASTLFYQSVFDYQDSGLLSVWLTNETYTGGAHGMSWVSSYNVNPETGEFYEFRDLFRNPEEAIPEITDKILSHLKNILTDESLYETASEAVRALDGQLFVLPRRRKSGRYFQPYDVAPMPLGSSVCRSPCPPCPI